MSLDLLTPIFVLSINAHSNNRISAFTEAALANPNTTRSGRKHAKRELRLMVCDFPPTRVGVDILIHLCNCGLSFLGSKRRGQSPAYDED